MKPARKADPSPTTETGPPRAFTPEAMAKRAVSGKPTTSSGHRVKFALTLFLSHDLAQ